eukprot:286650-Pelagomonas_calceolata.AAC.1
MSFATLPDSGCGYTLSELIRLFGPIVLLRSLMACKMKNICCSDVPIPRPALSVKSMPHSLSTTSLFYIKMIIMSPTGCPVLTPFTM